MKRSTCALSLLALLAVLNCGVTEDEFHRRIDTLEKKLLDNKVALTPATFVFDRLVTSDLNITPATFIKVSPDGLPLAVASTCGAGLELDAESATGKPGATAELAKTVEAAAKGTVLGTGGAIGTIDPADWLDFGLGYDTIKVSAGFGMPVLSVNLRTETSSVSFQAWRRLSRRPIKETSQNGKLQSVVECCALNGCGDYLVTATERVDRYRFTFSDLSIAAGASYTVYSGSLDIDKVKTQFSFTKAVLLSIMKVPPKAAAISDICALPAIHSDAAGASSSIEFYCPFSALMVESGANLSSVTKSYTKDTGNWKVTFQMPATGIVGYLNFRHPSVAPWSTTIVGTGPAAAPIAPAPSTPPPPTIVFVDRCAAHSVRTCTQFNQCMRTNNHNACNGMRNAARDAGCYAGAWDC